MAELTEREQKIVHMLNVMNNPMLKEVPFDIRTKALQATLLAYGYEWNQEDMTDLMTAVNNETQEGMKRALKFLGKYGDSMKGLGKL